MSDPYTPPPPDAPASMRAMDEALRVMLEMPPRPQRLIVLLQFYDKLPPHLQREYFGVCAVYLTQIWDPPQG